MTAALPAAVRHGARAREWLQLLISFVCATAKDARTEQQQLSITAAAAADSSTTTAATSASASGKADHLATTASLTQGNSSLLLTDTHESTVHAVHQHSRALVT